MFADYGSCLAIENGHSLAFGEAASQTGSSGINDLGLRVVAEDVVLNMKGNICWRKLDDPICHPEVR